MRNREGSFEKEAEAILRAYAKELQKSRNDYLDALESEKIPDPPLFSERPRQQIRVRKLHKIRLKRVLILVAVLVLLMGLAVVSSEGARKQFFGFFLNDKEGHTEVKFLGDEESASGLPDYELGYVPEGFKLYEVTDDGVCKEISYLGKEKQRMILTVSKADRHAFSVDNDTFERKEVTVNGCQAFLFYDESECLLAWQNGDYVLELLSTCSEKEVLKIAQHIISKK